MKHDPARRTTGGPRPEAARSARALLGAACLVASCGGGDAPGGNGSSETDGTTAAADGESSGPPWFSEEAAARGLVFQHDSGVRPGRLLMPENMCGGAALFDADGDGDLDAYLVQAGDFEADPAARPGNQLFQNDGSGRFRDVTDGSGADDRGVGMGVASGDVDGDGDVDLYVTNTGPNALLVNDGDFAFRDTTGIAGVGDPGFGASAGFVDVDHDGDLDLLTLNYLHWSLETELTCSSPLGIPDYCSPKTYARPARDVLYRNRGDGTFEDVTQSAGLAGAFGNGLGLAASDFDGDGLVDLFIANDGTPDQLWVNQGDGTFIDDALFAGCAVDQDGRAKAGMGVTVGDVDFDGDPDLLVCNFVGETDSFFRNQGGTFRDSTAIAGLGKVSRSFTRFGMAWVDLDHDGYLDLFQANGRVNIEAKKWAEDPYAEPNLLMKGGPNVRFDEVLPRGGTQELLIANSRGAAFGDVDGDGAIDILVVNRDGPAHLLMNRVPERGNSAVLSVLETSGAPALGARVALRVGERQVVQEIRAAYSYQSSNDPRMHVGLGVASRVEGVQVTWVDGVTETFGDFEAEALGRVVELRRGAGQ